MHFSQQQTQYVQPPRYAQFLRYLNQLKKDFPEYAETLDLLIIQIQNGQEARLKAIMKKLSEDW